MVFYLWIENACFIQFWKISLDISQTHRLIIFMCLDVGCYNNENNNFWRIFSSYYLRSRFFWLEEWTQEEHICTIVFKKFSGFVSQLTYNLAKKLKQRNLFLYTQSQNYSVA